MSYVNVVLKQMKILMVLWICVCLIGACKKKEDQPPQVDTDKTGSVTSDTEWVPLPIVLPTPMFVGTPQNVEGVTNLEKVLGNEREPFLAPKGITNVALNKPVTSSAGEPIMGDLAQITDGDKEATDGSLVELLPFTQHITIDLEQTHEIYAVLIWHYHKQVRVYFDVVVQTSSDADFITNVHTLFNNDNDNTSGQGVGDDKNYRETSEGKLIDAKGIKGRYVRLYSMGSNASDQNHYLEVEVYGKPIQ